MKLRKKRSQNRTSAKTRNPRRYRDLTLKPKKLPSKAYAADGILINAVSPATIRTPLVEGIFEDLAQERNISKEEAEAAFLRETRPNIVLERTGEPQETAAVVVFLASEAASFVTGSNYRVDGGSVASIS